MPLDWKIPGRTERVAELWEAGITTAEMGRVLTKEFGEEVSKNAVISIVHRMGLVPRILVERPRQQQRNVFAYTGPVCMWPHGHPGDEDFHFCGGRPLPGRPYCSEHCAVAYIKPKDPNEKRQTRALQDATD